MVIPNWLNKYLNSEDLSRIEQSVREVEKFTEAEIVPVIVKSSSAYKQTVVTLALTGVLIFSILWEAVGLNTHWDAFSVSILKMLIAFVGIIVSSRFLAKIPWVQKLFTVRSEELEQCQKRAQIEFYENCVYQTQDRVGILIFISLLEKAVVVWADEKIAQTLPKETWQKVVDEIVIGMKDKKMSLGIEKGLKECSSLLKQHFPVKSNDVDELSNKVIIKE